MIKKKISPDDFKFRKEYKKAVTDIVMEYRERGATYGEITVFLNENYETFSGIGAWFTQTVHRVYHENIALCEKRKKEKLFDVEIVEHETYLIEGVSAKNEEDAETKALEIFEADYYDKSEFICDSDCTVKATRLKLKQDWKSEVKKRLR
jgi:hypothetical protein